MEEYAGRHHLGAAYMVERLVVENKEQGLFVATEQTVKSLK